MVVEIHNNSERQLFIDTKGDNKPESIKIVGIKETVVLEVSEKVLKKIKATLPNSVLINIK